MLVSKMRVKTREKREKYLLKSKTKAQRERFVLFYTTRGVKMRACLSLVFLLFFLRLCSQTVTKRNPNA